MFESDIDYHDNLTGPEGDIFLKTSSAGLLIGTFLYCYNTVQQIAANPTFRNFFEPL
jgi:hypothetical protein